MDDGWTDERVSRLKKLWESGLSAGQIRDQFGDVTRGAVIGKIHRLGLSAKDQKNRPDSAKLAVTIATRNAQVVATRPAAQVKYPAPKTRPAPQPQMPRRNISNSIPAAVAIKAAEPGLPKRLEEPAVGEGIQMMQLTNTTCRWPFGDPLTERFYYCGTGGADCDGGKPYCEFHTRKAANPHAVNPKMFVKSAERSARR